MSLENDREELIQVAAVAVAIVEDLDYGVAGDHLGSPQRVLEILEEVDVERQAQDEKWGPQHHDPFTWLMILMEEVGEFAEEIELGDPKLPDNFPPAYLRERVAHLGRQAKRWLERRGLG